MIDEGARILIKSGGGSLCLDRHGNWVRNAPRQVDGYAGGGPGSDL